MGGVIVDCGRRIPDGRKKKARVSFGMSSDGCDSGLIIRKTGRLMVKERDV